MYSFASVYQLNEYADGKLGSDPYLSSLSVTGEISGFKVYSSGHAYFTLKDSAAEISCVMFASSLGQVPFRPKDGDKVIITGSCSIYKKSGKFQIIAKSMKHEGKGDLKEQLKQLYDKLSKEGIFDPGHKKKLPVLPGRIGIITSPTGAVIHDMLVKLNERNPYFDAVLYPAAVQGENCPGEIIKGLDFFTLRGDVDVIIIARGGGSIEDLWGFNSEALARKVYDCPIPVISAVGHETDVTILDHAADKRSPTPTAAAEDVIRPYAELVQTTDMLRESIRHSMRNNLSGKRAELNYLISNKALYSPEFTVKLKRGELDALSSKLAESLKSRLIRERELQNSFINGLSMLGPHNVLMRGYSYVTSDDGNAVQSISQIDIGHNVKINFKDGFAYAAVTDISKEDVF